MTSNDSNIFNDTDHLATSLRQLSFHFGLQFLVFPHEDYNIGYIGYTLLLVMPCCLVLLSLCCYFIVSLNEINGDGGGDVINQVLF